MSCSNSDHHTPGNGASLLVLHGHEASEESDQENCGALDNGSLAKSHLNRNNGTGGVFEKSPQATNRESEMHHPNPATLLTPADRSESTSGISDAPEKVGISGNESKNLPQKIQVTEEKNSGGERNSYPSKERNYRYRRPDREGDGDRHQYRRANLDNRDNHRLHSDHLSPHDRHYRDWNSERRYEPIVHHPRESYRDRSPHHDHRHRSRDDRDFEQRGNCRCNEEEFRSRWRWPQESGESRVTAEKNRGKERNSYPSKEETSFIATVPYTEAKYEGSPPLPRDQLQTQTIKSQEGC
ncbi:unnamed protein product [Pleuronectes platessa]|uniref:Uncharacterized protein n=1 Tax=Pleuronectes platessa TaxID=8262 RepID=A0A9N7UK61_PLEPL|nr:unnamed protein product [Pleuronectes platessa]